jgi:Fe-Mn family superoxide dismutase
MPYTLPNLPYAANVLEPYIDTMTMEIHHGRHHKAYVDTVNKALESQPALSAKPIEQLLREIGQVSEASRQAVINNGGGHANHSMFWEIMAPKAGGQPSGPLADDIKSTFGEFTAFQTQLKQAGVGRFGSGWAWLVLADGKLKIISSANQDSPYMTNQAPSMGIEVGEHAYYLT